MNPIFEAPDEILDALRSFPIRRQALIEASVVELAESEDLATTSTGARFRIPNKTSE